MPCCCHLLQCRQEKMWLLQFSFTALNSFLITTLSLTPHCLHLSVALCPPHYAFGPFQFPLSLLFLLFKNASSQSQTGQSRLISRSERPQLSLSWLSPVSCWGSAATCLQHFMKNIFHYIFHFQLSTFLSYNFRLKQQEFCIAYLVQHDLSVSCWKKISRH